MNENTEETESLGEEIDIEETQDQPAELGPRNSKTNNKKRRPKRGGCGDATTGLAGDATSGLAGDATSGLGPGGGKDIPTGSVQVVKSNKIIGRGKTITDKDVYYSISAMPNSDMLRDKMQAVDRVATQRIPKDKILEKNMVK